MHNKYFITKIIKDNVWFYNGETEVRASFKGSLRLNEIKISVGDYVEYTYENNSYQITKIIDRKNFLLRPKVSNVDKVIIVQSCIEPNFNSLLLNKMILFYTLKNVDVEIAISKLDMVNKNNDTYKYISDLRNIGFKCYELNVDSDFKEMTNSFSGNIICFVGNSGVGKSTLINRINPNLKLSTQEISKSLNRGKHTTTNSSIIKINDFFIVDTPGYSTIDITLDSRIVSENFFKKETNNNFLCKFNDCIHIHEKDCKIKEMLNNKEIFDWRYNDYLTIISKLR